MHGLLQWLARFEQGVGGDRWLLQALAVGALVRAVIDLAAAAVAHAELAAQPFHVRGEFPELMRRRPAHDRARRDLTFGDQREHRRPLHSRSRGIARLHHVPRPNPRFGRGAGGGRVFHRALGARLRLVAAIVDRSTIRAGLLARARRGRLVADRVLAPAAQVSGSTHKLLFLLVSDIKRIGHAD